MNIRFMTLMAILLAAGGCGLAAEDSGLDNFDRAVAQFQAHLVDCQYPLIHTIRFANLWDLEPGIAEETYRFLRPEGLNLERGLPDPVGP